MITHNITKRRKALGYSQAELARRIGISRQRLSRLMCNPIYFTIDTLAAIAEQLNCYTADLLGYDGESQDKLDKVREILK